MKSRLFRVSFSRAGILRRRTNAATSGDEGGPRMSNREEEKEKDEGEHVVSDT